MSKWKLFDNSFTNLLTSTKIVVDYQWKDSKNTTSYFSFDFQTTIDLQKTMKTFILRCNVDSSCANIMIKKIIKHDERKRRIKYIKKQKFAHLRLLLSRDLIQNSLTFNLIFLIDHEISSFFYQINFFIIFSFFSLLWFDICNSCDIVQFCS